MHHLYEYHWLMVIVTGSSKRDLEGWDCFLSAALQWSQGMHGNALSRIFPSLSLGFVRSLHTGKISMCNQSNHAKANIKKELREEGKLRHGHILSVYGPDSS